MRTKKSTMVYLPDDIDKSMRVHAAIERRSLSSVVELALRRYLEDAGALGGDAPSGGEAA